MIEKLLIANRGEIAVRVIRAAREMGIRTVAVFSEADRDAMHTQLADEAICIGPPEPSESYLKMDTILDAACEFGAQAIHPGYGFLSERAELAEACQKTGLIFIGPPATAMRALGAKIDAKRLAVEQDVPITPGFFEPGASADQIQAAADQIGYPVMLKASAGGGGRGMRVVREPSALRGEFEIATQEALSGFGDGAMMVEKLIERPRHVEVQILADQHGTVACLFERECSIQRRHQKLIEECPSPGLIRLQERGIDLWPAMREASIRLAKAAGYVGAGTVEFMVDEPEGKFYFLEVNARLQVEHPVTEAITGLDLVQWQIRVAQGEQLNLPEWILEGDRRAIQGHAIEVRVVAEDPAKNFLPSAGKILGWAEPSLPGLRVDTGFAAGKEVPRYYDSLLAKVIAHCQTREAALSKLREALLDFHILGIRTNIAFLLDVLRHKGFKKGEFDTGFLEREFGEWCAHDSLPEELAALIKHAEAQAPASKSLAQEQTQGAWSLQDSWHNAQL